MAHYFRRSILPSRHVTRQARNSNPVLFQSSPSRFYTNSKFPSPPPNIPSDTTAFVLDKYLGKIEKALKFMFVSSTIFVPGDLLFAWCWNRYNEHKLNETVEKGTRPDVKINAAEFVPRPLITEYLKKILVPTTSQSSYYVVCGEHGTGKSTLMRVASREVGQNKRKGIKGGRGVIYVSIPPEMADVETFGEQFGLALNFTFEERISFTEQLLKKIFGFTNYKDSNKDPKWIRALRAFKRAAAVYKKNNPCHQPPVIVYDNISHIDPKILDFLQDDAKDNADDRNYITVFVCSEGSVPGRMESLSSISRADDPIEIGDLTKKESLNYLIEKRGIDKVEAEKLYELVGGRILNLNMVANKLQKGKSFDDIKKSILKQIEKDFGAAKLLQNDAYYKIGKSIINDLLKSNELSFLAFKKYFHKVDELNEVLGKNVFAYHPEKNTVTFQSQSVKYYILEKGDMFIKKSWFFF